MTLLIYLVSRSVVVLLCSVRRNEPGRHAPTCHNFDSVCEDVGWLDVRSLRVLVRASGGALVDRHAGRARRGAAKHARDYLPVLPAGSELIPQWPVEASTKISELSAARPHAKVLGAERTHAVPDFLTSETASRPLLYKDTTHAQLWIRGCSSTVTSCYPFVVGRSLQLVGNGQPPDRG
jgi:hypothetical protein